MPIKNCLLLKCRWAQLQFLITASVKRKHLNHPVCIQVVCELVYVTSRYSHYVSVFHTSGEYVTNFGERHLYQPEGIAVDEDGYVYVSNIRRCVVVF